MEEYEGLSTLMKCYDTIPESVRVIETALLQGEEFPSLSLVIDESWCVGTQLTNLMTLIGAADDDDDEEEDFSPPDISSLPSPTNTQYPCLSLLSQSNDTTSVGIMLSDPVFSSCHTLQRVFRGFGDRLRVGSQSVALSTIKSCFNGMKSRIELKNKFTSRKQSSLQLQRISRGLTDRISMKSIISTLSIQRLGRGLLTRQGASACMTTSSIAPVIAAAVVYNSIKKKMKILTRSAERSCIASAIIAVLGSGLIRKRGTGPVVEGGGSHIRRVQRRRKEQQQQQQSVILPESKASQDTDLLRYWAFGGELPSTKSLELMDGIPSFRGLQTPSPISKKKTTNPLQKDRLDYYSSRLSRGPSNRKRPQSAAAVRKRDSSPSSNLPSYADFLDVIHTAVGRRKVLTVRKHYPDTQQDVLLGFSPNRHSVFGGRLSAMR